MGGQCTKGQTRRALRDSTRKHSSRRTAADGARGQIVRRLCFECCYLLSFRSVSSNSFINVFSFLPLLSAWVLYSSFLPFGNVTVKRSYFSAINLFCRSSCFSSAGFRVMQLSAPPFVRNRAPQYYYILCRAYYAIRNLHKSYYVISQIFLQYAILTYYVIRCIIYL